MAFHRSRFVFSYEGETHPGCDTDAKAIQIMQNHYAKNNRGNEEEISHCSDMDLYRRLVAQPGCASVSICQIRLRGLVQGYTRVQVVYRSRFSDGRVETTKGPFYGERRGRNMPAIKLQEKEWITVFRLDYNRFCSIGNTDWIFWKTSEGRSEKEGIEQGFSVWGNNNEKDYVPDGGHFRLVALAVSTTSTGGLRIGAFCESSRWGRIQDLVLYRNLLQKKRASVLPSAEERIRALFSEDFEEDVFRHVLGFL